MALPLEDTAASNDRLLASMRGRLGDATYDGFKRRENSHAETRCSEATEFPLRWRRTRGTAMWTGLHFYPQAIMTIAKGKHQYRVTVNWTGNCGTGTSSYKAYSRNYVIQASGKPDMPGSSDPAFRGDPARWNPEDMLVASLSACHKLWYLHFCAVEGVRVEAYRDEAEGVMVEDPERGGAFTLVTLRPEVTIRAGDDAALAAELHDRAHHFCFIANSVNFPIRCEPRIVYAQ